MSSVSPRRLEIFQAARACYGLALLTVPGPLITACTGRPASGRARNVARILGARHVLQAALTAGADPDPAWLASGAAVDVSHAASMVGLAAISRPIRRAPLTDAVIETAIAATGLAFARQLAGQSLVGPGRPRWRLPR